MKSEHLDKRHITGYPIRAAGIPTAGFDSPNIRRTHRLSLPFGGIFVSAAWLAPFGRLCGEPQGSPVPDAGLSTRTAALFAFDSAGGEILTSGASHE